MEMTKESASGSEKRQAGAQILRKKPGAPGGLYTVQANLSCLEFTPAYSRTLSFSSLFVNLMHPLGNVHVQAQEL